MAHSLSRPWFWLSRMARISCLFSSKYCSDPWIMIPPPAHTTAPRFSQPKQQELRMHCMETAEDDHTTDVAADHLRLLILQTLTSRNVVKAHAWSIHSSKSSRIVSDPKEGMLEHSWAVGDQTTHEVLGIVVSETQFRGTRTARAWLTPPDWWRFCEIELYSTNRLPAALLLLLDNLHNRSHCLRTYKAVEFGLSMSGENGITAEQIIRVFSPVSTLQYIFCNLPVIDQEQTHEA